MKLVINFRGQRRILIRETFFRLARRFTPVLAVEDDGVRFLVSTSDDVIGRVTFMYEGFDEEAMHRAVSVLAGHTGVEAPLRDRVVVDVGANIGTTTVYAVRRFGAAAVLAFEPEPGNLDLLRQNVAANALTDAVTVDAVAISDADGEVTFELSAQDGGDHRVRVGGAEEAPGAMDEARRRVISVPARRLDTALTGHGLDAADVAMVWVDVQGHEAHVLEGASELIAAGVPFTIEYWPYGLQRAGGLDRLHALISEGFAEVVDLGPPAAGLEPVVLPAGEVASLAARYTGPTGFCDLVLLPARVDGVSGSRR